MIDSYTKGPDQARVYQMQRIECTGTHNQLNIHHFDKVAVHIRMSVFPTLVPLDIEKVVSAIRQSLFFNCTLSKIKL